MNSTPSSPVTEATGHRGALKDGKRSAEHNSFLYWGKTYNKTVATECHQWKATNSLIVRSSILLFSSFIER